MQVGFNRTCIITAIALLVGATGIVVIFWAENIGDVWIGNAGYGLLMLALVVFMIGMVSEMATQGKAGAEGQRDW